MQINAVNLNRVQSFKGIENDYDNQNQYFVSDSSDEHYLSNFIDDVTKARNDVSPLTCIVGVLAGYATLKSSSKIVGFARGAAATLGQGLTKGAVGLASKIFKSIDAEKAGSHIDKFFSKFSNSADMVSVNNDKAVQKAQSIVKSIFGEKDKNNIDKGVKFVTTLNNQGVYLNGRSLFDNALALGAAFFMADTTSDITESAIDGRHIEKSAVKNLGNLKGFNRVVQEVLTAVE